MMCLSNKSGQRRLNRSYGRCHGPYPTTGAATRDVPAVREAGPALADSKARPAAGGGEADHSRGALEETRGGRASRRQRKQKREASSGTRDPQLCGSVSRASGGLARHGGAPPGREAGHVPGCRRVSRSRGARPFCGGSDSPGADRRGSVLIDVGHAPVGFACGLGPAALPSDEQERKGRVAP
jgi:hypothetical protein